MMKQVFLILFAVLSIQLVKSIELEPRAGIGGVYEWGLHAGAYVSFPVSNVFAIQTGGLLYSGDNWKNSSSKWNIGLNIPVYASFRLPVSQTTNIRLSAGPYVGIASLGQLGFSAETGVEVKKVYIGAAIFQNCLNKKDTQVGISVGYKFAL